MDQTMCAGVGSTGAGVLDAEVTAARQQTDGLFARLEPAALLLRCVPERHRLLFYVGHLEAFDWNLLARASGLGDCAAPPGVSAELCRLFAFGIDPDPKCPSALPSDRAGDWPALPAVRAFSAACRKSVDALLPQVPADVRAIALEHRLMHAETLCYLLHFLPQRSKRGMAARHAAATAQSAALATRPLPPDCAAMAPIEAGPARLGRASRGPCQSQSQDAAGGFGWDNEFPALRIEVPEFRIRRFKVTNGEYLRFVEAGGEPPLFWRYRPSRGGFFLRGMFGELPLPHAWPVYVTQAQASAYAAYCGMRLPTEAEYDRAAYGVPGDGAEGAAGARDRQYPWGGSAGAPGPSGCDRAHGNFDFAAWDPQPVDAHPLGASAFGVEQLVGNGWEWTSTPFSPLPGFAPEPLYPGYSADFFDGRHYVAKGGSARTARRLLRRTFRNFYRPDYRYAYAGFRLVEL